LAEISRAADSREKTAGLGRRIRDWLRLAAGSSDRNSIAAVGAMYASGERSGLSQHCERVAMAKVAPVGE
jgi:hypothetical protein